MIGVSVPVDDHDDWLQARTRGVGGSDVAAIVGLSPFGTAATVWLHKTGRHPGVDVTPQMMWGSRLEGAILAAYLEDTPTDNVVTGSLFHHPDRVHHLGTPDAVLPSAGGIVEVKTAGHYATDEWDTGVPVHYQIQCQWYLHVVGGDWADVAVLIAGSDYRTFRLGRDDTAIGRLVERVDQFWEEHVVADIPPAVTASSDQLRFIPATPGKTIDLPATALDIVADYRTASAAVKAAEAAKALAADQLRGLLIDAEEGLVDGHTVVTWKPSKPSAKFDVDRFAVDHPHLYAQYQTVRPGSRRLLPKGPRT